MYMERGEGFKGDLIEFYRSYLQTFDGQPNDYVVDQTVKNIQQLLTNSKKYHLDDETFAEFSSFVSKYQKPLHSFLIQH